MRKALLLFALVFPSIAVFSYFHLATRPEEVRFWYSASKILQFSLPVIGALWFGMGRRWRFDLQDWGMGVLSGLAILLSLGLFYYLVRDLSFVAVAREEIGKKLVDFGASTPMGFLALSVFISVAHSFLEEYYWRGFVFDHLLDWIGTGWAYFASALAFTGHHIVVIHKYAPADGAWFLVPAFSAFVFVGGLFWAWAYQRSGSLVGAWISHFFADVAILSVGAHLVFYT